MLISSYLTQQVVIVGAGLGGIITAILLSHKVPNLEYTVFDRQDRIVSEFGCVDRFTCHVFRSFS